MSTEDDQAYKKSVRNMSIVLAAIVVTVFAAIFVPAYLFPTHDQFLKSVSSDSPVGFSMHLQINATSFASGEGILLTGWVNSTSDSLANITAANAWSVPRAGLWGPFCEASWPIGVGVMKGHYTQDNYSLGALIPLQYVAMCPKAFPPPTYFIFEPHSSKVLFTVGGSPGTWTLQTYFAVSSASAGQMPPGVYTAVFADEWGDVLTTNFQVV